MTKVSNSILRPQVGMGIFVFKKGNFIMLQRLGAHGSNTWSIPGGHIEFGESFEETAKREVKEETNLNIKNIRFGAVTNDYFASENKHYITIWMISEWASGKEEIVEPDKCINLTWKNFNNLPKPLFLPWKQLLDSEFIENIKKSLERTNN